MEYSSPIQFLDDNRANQSHAPLVCYAPTMISMNGIWHGERPLDYSLPLFILQLMLIILTTRFASLVLKPLNQPRYISEIAGGLILGPSILGRIPMFSITMFPLRSLLIIEAVANLGLIFFVFTVGVELEINVVSRTGWKKALIFALACIVGPLAIGMTSALGLRDSAGSNANRGAFVTYLGVVLSVTAFSALASILAELKLLSSCVGHLAVSSALLNDAVAWILLSLAISLQQSNGNVLGSLWTVLSGAVFTVGCFFAVRPAILWVTRHTPEGEDVDELYTCGIIVGVLVSSLIADVIGTHAVFGAFIYGLAVPNGTVGESVIDKVEDFVNGLLLPLFFVINGLRTDLRMITDGLSALKLVVIVIAGAAAKVGGCVLSSMLYQMPMQDGIELGLLMNTKGIIQLIILNVGKDKRIINSQSFTIMVLMSILLTALVSPLLNTVARSSRRFVAYKRRTIRWPNPDSELRILTCIHHPRDVPSSITLLGITHPTKRSPIFIYVLHLIELTGRAATLLVNSSASNDASTTGTGHGKVQTQSEQVVNAFETYEQHAGGVSVQTLTAFSPYQTMHEDICNIAEDKHVALILLPFHKHQTVDGFMEVTHPSIRSLNQNALASAPCSMGILIDRGLSVPRTHQAALHVALIFFGGPDDRESLAFASRMAGHPNISFTLLRFIPNLFNLNDVVERSITVDDRERRLDEACLEEFKLQWEGREAQYAERESRNAEDTVAGIREIVERGAHDLCIVGRAYGAENPLMTGLTDWSECPELGAIGDLLSSSDFASGVSVFVVQQGKVADGIGNVMPDSPGRHVQVHVSKPGW